MSETDELKQIIAQLVTYLKQPEENKTKSLKQLLEEDSQVSFAKDLPFRLALLQIIDETTQKDL